MSEGARYETGCVNAHSHLPQSSRNYASELRIGVDVGGRASLRVRVVRRGGRATLAVAGRQRGKLASATQKRTELGWLASLR